MDMIIPLIIAGGSGTRLWPISREHYPKQLWSFSKDGYTLLQRTAKRLEKIPDVLPPIVLCNENHRFMVAEQLRQMDLDATIILEPVARNTAPAVTLGALSALDKVDDPLILVLPADHNISRPDEFSHAVKVGSKIAPLGHLITLESYLQSPIPATVT